MALLPSIASYSSNIADLFTKPLPRHRFDALIGDTATVAPTTSVASTLVASPLVASTAVVASTPTVDSLTAVVDSDSVPTLHPNLVLAPTLPFVLDTGAPIAHAPLASDFALAVFQAPCGLIRSAFDTSVVSDSKAHSTFASTPVDPDALVTGEDAVAFDLSSTDPTLASDSVESCEFGAATLTFICSDLDLIKVFVTPTQVDWFHWVPLPRLTPTESCFHIFGLDYFQAFTLLHLIPIWICYLLHFAINLE